MNEKQEQAIVDILLKLQDKNPVDPDSGLVPYAGKKESDIPANMLVNDLENCPHAFVIACVLDRGIKAERAWAGPYKLKKRIGSFKFSKLRALTPGDWKNYLGPQKGDDEKIHRYWEKQMPQCLHSAVKIIDKYSDGIGDASRIWSGNPLGKDMVGRFREIHGVGQKISNMAARILVTNHGVKMKTSSIDVSVDVQVKRVFSRLGLVEENAPPKKIINKGRELHPEFPGLIDPPIWHIGRDFCETIPKCGECPMNKLCDYARSRK